LRVGLIVDVGWLIWSGQSVDGGAAVSLVSSGHVAIAVLCCAVLLQSDQPTNQRIHQSTNRETTQARRTETIATTEASKPHPPTTLPNNEHTLNGESGLVVAGVVDLAQHRSTSRLIEKKTNGRKTTVSNPPAVIPGFTSNPPAFFCAYQLYKKKSSPMHKNTNRSIISAFSHLHSVHDCTSGLRFCRIRS
jgi:hypothetical protein